MTLSRTTFGFEIMGHVFLSYLLILMPLYLFEPESSFDLPFFLWLIHLVLLYVHEAGHLLLGFLGTTIAYLGGSLFQILAPLLWYILARREDSRLRFIALFFAGLSVADVSLYIKDASMLKLPLLGGSKARHDWAYLLNEWGLIEYAVVLGTFLFCVGFIVSSLGLTLGAKESIRCFLARKDFNQEKMTSTS